MFDTYETSNHGGRPVALYEIWWGNTRWRYTSADSVQTYGGNDFLPVSISDEGMTQGGSSENDFQVTCQSDLPIIALYAESPPTAPVWMRVRRKHVDDPDSEAPVFWIGRIGNVMREDNAAEATIRGIALTRLLKSGGLRLTWTKNCPHCVYDSACRADPAAHKTVALVENVQGSFVSLTEAISEEEAVLPFTGGFLEYDRDGNGTLERRGIEVQAGTFQVKALGRVPGLIPGMTVALYPGCDQTASTCNDRFGNIDNNGGFFFMPEKSPFDGTQVFD